MHIGYHLNRNKYPNLLSALKKLDKIKADAVQIFVGDNHVTTLSKKNKFTSEDFILIKEYLKKKNIKLNIHGLLSLNYCFPPDSPRFKWGLDNLIHDMNVCKKIDCQGIVIHTGSYKTPSINIGYQDCLNNFEMEYLSDDLISKIQSRNFKISDEVFNCMISIYHNNYGIAEYKHGIQGYKMNIQMSSDYLSYIKNYFKK